MTCDANDPSLHALRHLTVLEPEPARSARVRYRCRAVLAERLRGERPTARRFAATVFESGLMYGLSVGYLFAMIQDLLMVYMRR